MEGPEMEDSGWGGYVPLPDETSGRQPPTGGAGSGSQPPAGSRPWWRRNIMLVVAAVVALGIGGGTALALSSGSSSSSPPVPSPVTTSRITPPVSPTPDGPGPTSPGGNGGLGPTSPVGPTPSGSSSDPFVAFVARANAICSRFKPKLARDFGSWNSGDPGLVQDTKDLINALQQLGTPTSDLNGVNAWQYAMTDWKQAVSFLVDIGDIQDWQINIFAGAQQFRDMGIQACGSYESFGG